jgi:haloalkane dehalogenase
MKIEMAVGRLKSEKHYIPLEQGRVACCDYAGSGPAFVLTHGFPDNQLIYDDLVPYLLAAGRRVVTFDLLRFRESDRKPGAQYSFDQQLGDLKSVVDGSSLGKVVPVGHDGSGPAAINFALAHPESVHSVCLLNTFYAAVPSVRILELVGLLATTGLKALSAAILDSTEQFAWLLRFQQRLFIEALPESQRPHFAEMLLLIIEKNFSLERNTAVAFTQMIEQIYPHVQGNTVRLPSLAGIAVPVTFIWGARRVSWERGDERPLALV